MSRTILCSLGLAAALGAGAACEASRYGHVELFELRGTAEADIDRDGIVVPEGGVIVFEAKPRADGASPEYVGLERFKLRPGDPDVAMARRSILRDTWVVNGVAMGTTELHVMVDGDVVDRIPVEVTAPVDEEGAP